jgi:hypothetical protein
MQNTTPALPSLESIHADALLFVSGGCHKHCRPCCSQNQQTIINMPPAPVPQVLPQAAPAPAPVAGPSVAPAGDSVTTNVSINGQPVS